MDIDSKEETKNKTLSYFVKFQAQDRIDLS